MRSIEISTLDTVADAQQMLADLATQHEWVSVFWDRGWGDSDQEAEISIIVDGDGQDPKAFITPWVYAALRDQQVIGPNTLRTFKARRVHDYKTPPPAPKPNPETDPIRVAERTVRNLLSTMADRSVRADFYRGMDPHSRLPRVQYETAVSDGYEQGWHALVLPGASDAAVSAQVMGPLGVEPIEVATTIRYPRDSAGEVDVAALAGDSFRSDLRALVEEQLAAVAARRAEQA